MLVSKYEELFQKLILSLVLTETLYFDHIYYMLYLPFYGFLKQKSLKNIYASAWM